MSTTRHALTVLTRLAGRRPEESPKLAAALSGRLARLGAEAVQVAIETGDPIGRVLDSLLNDCGDPSIAELLEPLLPSESVALREVAATVARMRLLQSLDRSHSSDETSIPSKRVDYSARLSAIGQRDDALVEASLAVDALLELRPIRDATLARALAVQSACLADVGRHSEALAAILRAVELREQLVESSASEAASELARVLGQLAACHRALGNRPQALAAGERAVSVARRIASVDGWKHRPVLADQLSKLATLRIEAADFDGALTVGSEALELYRTLAERNPDRFLPLVGSELNNVANELALNRRFDEALPLLHEAESIFGKLASTRPNVFGELYARVLNSLSNRLNDLGRTPEALVVSRRSVGILRPLADSEPAAFEQRLGMSLHTLAYRLFEAGELAESLAVIDEAIAIRTRLLQFTPAASKVALAMSRAVRASTLRKGRSEAAACTEIATAVQLLAESARELGPSIAREAREIGGRAVNWHAEAGIALDTLELAELGRLTGVESFGKTT